MPSATATRRRRCPASTGFTPRSLAPEVNDKEFCMPSALPNEQIRLLADRFVGWQTPYGRPDPRRCPFVTPGKCVSTHFHSPTFLAIGLYDAFDATGEEAY